MSYTVNQLRLFGTPTGAQPRVDVDLCPFHEKRATDLTSRVFNGLMQRKAFSDPLLDAGTANPLERQVSWSITKVRDGGAEDFRIRATETSDSTRVTVIDISRTYAGDNLHWIAQQVNALFQGLEAIFSEHQAGQNCDRGAHSHGGAPSDDDRGDSSGPRSLDGRAHPLHSRSQPPAHPPHAGHSPAHDHHPGRPGQARPSDHAAAAPALPPSLSPRPPFTPASASSSSPSPSASNPPRRNQQDGQAVPPPGAGSTPVRTPPAPLQPPSRHGEVGAGRRSSSPGHDPSRPASPIVGAEGVDPAQAAAVGRLRDILQEMNARASAYTGLQRQLDDLSSRHPEQEAHIQSMRERIPGELHVVSQDHADLAQLLGRGTPIGDAVVQEWEGVNTKQDGALNSMRTRIAELGAQCRGERARGAFVRTLRGLEPGRPRRPQAPTVKPSEAPVPPAFTALADKYAALASSYKGLEAYCKALENETLTPQEREFLAGSHDRGGLLDRIAQQDMHLSEVRRALNADIERCRLGKFSETRSPAQYKEQLEDLQTKFADLQGLSVRFHDRVNARQNPEAAAAAAAQEAAAHARAQLQVIADQYEALAGEYDQLNHANDALQTLPRTEDHDADIIQLQQEIAEEEALVIDEQERLEQALKPGAIPAGTPVETLKRLVSDFSKQLDADRETLKGLQERYREINDSIDRLGQRQARPHAQRNEDSDWELPPPDDEGVQEMGGLEHQAQQGPNNGGRDRPPSDGDVDLRQALEAEYEDMQAQKAEEEDRLPAQAQQARLDQGRVEDDEDEEALRGEAELVGRIDNLRYDAFPNNPVNPIGRRGSAPGILGGSQAPDSRPIDAVPGEQPVAERVNGFVFETDPPRLRPGPSSHPARPQLRPAIPVDVVEAIDEDQAKEELCALIARQIVQDRKQSEELEDQAERLWNQAHDADLGRACAYVAEIERGLQMKRKYREDVASYMDEYSLEELQDSTLQLETHLAVYGSIKANLDWAEQQIQAEIDAATARARPASFRSILFAPDEEAARSRSPSLAPRSPGRRPSNASVDSVAHASHGDSPPHSPRMGFRRPSLHGPMSPAAPVEDTSHYDQASALFNARVMPEETERDTVRMEVLNKLNPTKYTFDGDQLIAELKEPFKRTIAGVTITLPKVSATRLPEHRMSVDGIMVDQALKDEISKRVNAKMAPEFAALSKQKGTPAYSALLQKKQRIIATFMQQLVTVHSHLLEELENMTHLLARTNSPIHVRRGAHEIVTRHPDGKLVTRKVEKTFADEYCHLLHDYHNLNQKLALLDKEKAERQDNLSRAHKELRDLTGMAPEHMNREWIEGKVAEANTLFHHLNTRYQQAATLEKEAQYDRLKAASDALQHWKKVENAYKEYVVALGKLQERDKYAQYQKALGEYLESL